MSRAVVLVALFVSGAAGLMHEVVWAKLLISLIGNTADSNAVVLCVFMGGLAIGAVTFGKRADKWKKPLTVYAILEIAIGIYGLVIPTLIGIAGSLYEGLAAQIFEQTKLLLLLRIALAVVVVLPPAILMGATLPVLARYLIQEVAQTRREVASLYAMNNLGAVFGSGFAGLYLLGEFGIWGSLVSAMVCNILAAIFVMMIQMQAEKEGFVPDFEAQAASEPELTTASYTPAQYKMTLLALFFSGFAALGYEIVFIRVIALSFGSSTYSFTVMLMCFITGISIGSGLVSLVNVKRPLVWLGVTQLLVVVTFAPTTLLMERLPYLFALGRVEILESVRSFLAGAGGMSPDTGFYVYQLFKASLAVLALLIPTMCIGMSFPLVTQVQARSVSSIGGTVGSTYAWNTVGNVCGVLVTGQVLLNTGLGIWEVGGIRTAFEFNLIMSTLSGLCILVVAREWFIGLRAAMVAAALVMLSVYGFAWRDWPDSMNYAFNHLRLRQPVPENLDPGMQEAHPLHSYESWRRNCLVIEQDHEVDMILKEDENATVLAVSMPAVTSLFVNTKPEASCAVSFSDMNTQLLIAHLPALFNPDAKDLLMIGYGSGVTLGTAMLHPSLERADLAEISQAVLDVHPMFSRFNYDVLNNDKVVAYHEDARTFLRTSPRKYDIIISEPSNPWFVGVSALFTTEFFTEAKSKLTDDGILMMWFHQYEMEEENVQMVLRTLEGVFGENIICFLPDLADIICLASPKPFELDDAAFQAMEERFNMPMIRDDMAKIRMFNLATLFSYNIISPGRLADFAGEGPLNSDKHLRLEYAAPKSLFRAEESKFLNFVEGFNTLPDGGEDSLLEQYISYRSRTAEPMSKNELEIAAGHIDSQHGPDQSKLATRCRRLSLGLDAETSSGYSPARGGIPAPEDTEFIEANNRGVLLIMQDKVDEALPMLRRAYELHPENVGCRVNLSAAIAKSGDAESAIQLLEEGLAEKPGESNLALQLARTYMGFTRLDEAKQVLQEILAQNPDFPNPNALSLLGDIFNAEGNVEEALLYYRLAVENNVRFVDAGIKYVSLLLMDPVNYPSALQHVETILTYNPGHPTLIGLQSDLQGLISGELTPEQVFGPVDENGFPIDPEEAVEGQEATGEQAVGAATEESSGQ